MTNTADLAMELAIDYYTSMEAPSQAQIQLLRGLRSTSKLFKKCVDRRLCDPVWKADLTRRGREFCDDLAPGGVRPANVAPNAGVRRLLEAKNYAEL